MEATNDFGRIDFGKVDDNVQTQPIAVSIWKCYSNNIILGEWK